ncbi:oxygenase MpaB family protein [Limibacter armeniacum]|uniref:oxygenase MpaB family protein n=1 Tax=Limibacter armeniacum TaxID=466084 RepID=UPI002FE5947D
MKKLSPTKLIEQLDPVKDHQRIVFYLGTQVFWWDTEKALEFALFRTFAVPSISKLLEETGEFQQHPMKRYDDTELILAEISENGYNSERGKKAFRRMNAMHNYYNIGNEDMLYVLSTFIFEPIRWNAKYGWRPLSEKEKMASFYFWCEVGRRMNIKGMPETYDAFEDFNRRFEEKHFRFESSNQVIGNITVNLLLGFYMPKVFFPLGRYVVYAMMDNPLLDAMKFPHPPKWLRKMVGKGMQLRAGILRMLPKRKTPVLTTTRKRPTYPAGYAIESLGTFPKGKCPIHG